MDRYESSVQKLMDPDSRRKRIEQLRKTIKWSFVASVLFIVAAFVEYLGAKSALSGIMMGLAAMNLAIGASNANSLTLALYVEKAEKKRDSEQKDGRDARTSRPTS